jgi:hypothetical protein
MKKDQTRCKLKARDLDGLCWRHCFLDNNLVPHAISVVKSTELNFARTMHPQYIDGAWKRDQVVDALFRDMKEQNSMKEWLIKQSKHEDQPILILNTTLCNCVRDFYNNWMVYDYLSVFYQGNGYEYAFKKIYLAKEIYSTENIDRAIFVLNSEIKVEEFKKQLILYNRRHSDKIEKRSVLVFTTIPFTVHGVKLNQLTIDGCVHESRTKFITEVLIDMPATICAIIAAY